MNLIADIWQDEPETPIGNTLQRQMANQYKAVDVEMIGESGIFTHKHSSERWQNGNAPVLKTGIREGV